MSAGPPAERKEEEDGLGGRKSALRNGGTQEVAPEIKRSRLDFSEGGFANQTAGRSSGGDVRGEGGEDIQSDMRKLLSEMQRLSVSVEGKFEGLQRQLGEQAASFNEELGKLRVELVSRSEFEVLSGRVQALEAGGLPSPQVSWFQEQANRFDPANKSLCCTGFETRNAEERI